MALGYKKDDGFQAGCIQVDESGNALVPPSHPPSPAPEGAVSAHINNAPSPSVAGMSSADCSGAADRNVASLSTGSYSFQQQPPVTPASLPPLFSPCPPIPSFYPPIPPFYSPLYYLPSVANVCYRLPGELGSHHFSSSCYNGNTSSYPPLPPSSSSLLPSPHTHSCGRTTYTPKQLETLEDFFATKKYVSYEDRMKLSREIGMSEKQVKMWFQNRRTKMKKENNNRGVYVCHSN